MTNYDELFKDKDVDRIARNGVERVVHDMLREEHGKDSLVQRPISPRVDIPKWGPADYTAGIKAARRVEGFARRLVREYADYARGAGTPWRDLAGPLGIEPDEDGYLDRAEEAFKAIAPEPLRPFDPLWTGWRCVSCGESIVDRGPYGHPSDNERGHAEDCARHLAEIAAQEGS